MLTAYDSSSHKVKRDDLLLVEIGIKCCYSHDIWDGITQLNDLDLLTTLYKLFFFDLLTPLTLKIVEPWLVHIYTWFKINAEHVVISIFMLCTVAKIPRDSEKYVLLENISPGFTSGPNVCYFSKAQMCSVVSRRVKKNRAPGFFCCSKNIDQKKKNQPSELSDHFFFSW